VKSFYYTCMINDQGVLCKFFIQCVYVSSVSNRVSQLCADDVYKHILVRSNGNCAVEIRLAICVCDDE